MQKANKQDKITNMFSGGDMVVQEGNTFCSDQSRRKKGGTVLINKCTPQEGKLLFAASIDLLGYK